MDPCLNQVVNWPCFRGEKSAYLVDTVSPLAPPAQPGSTFTKTTILSDGSGWTNEFHLFDLQEGMHYCSLVGKSIVAYTCMTITQTSLYTISNYIMQAH